MFFVLQEAAASGGTGNTTYILISTLGAVAIAFLAYKTSVQNGRRAQNAETKADTATAKADDARKLAEESSKDAYARISEIKVAVDGRLDRLLAQLNLVSEARILESRQMGQKEGQETQRLSDHDAALSAAKAALAGTPPQITVIVPEPSK